MNISEDDPKLLSSLIYRQRLLLSIYILDKVDWRVIQGPFRGMLLPKPTGGWSNADLGAMALGIYENEVLAAIDRLPAPIGTFVNLGGADGYYSVGMLKSNIARRSICFEVNVEAHTNIRHLEKLNGFEGAIEVLGEASHGFLDLIQFSDNEKNFLLCDIEGGEFQLFDSPVIFARMKSFTFIIEVHARDREKLARAESIIKASISTHSHRWLTTGARDLSAFPILNDLDDSNRWLIASEGRPYRMSWLVLDPIR